MTPEIILRTNVGMLSRYLMNASRPAMQAFMDHIVPADWDMKVTSSRSDLDVITKEHRQIVNEFWRVAHIPSSRLAEQIRDELASPAASCSNDAVGPACAAIEVELQDKANDQVGSDMEAWGNERRRLPKGKWAEWSDGDTFGVAPNGGTADGSGTYGSAPVKSPSKGGTEGWPSRRPEPTKDTEIDWWQYRARDLREILESYGMETRMEKGPLIDSLHFLEDVKGFKIEPPKYKIAPSSNFWA